MERLTGSFRSETLAPLGTPRRPGTSAAECSCMGRTHALAAILLAILLPATAHAERPRSARGVRGQLASPRAPHVNHDWSVDLHVGTVAPLQMGGGLRLTLGRHFIVGGTVGITPRFYAEAMQGMVEQVHGGDHPEVAGLMSGAILFRGEVGIVLAPDFGVEFILNYTHLRASRAIAAPLVAAYMGVDAAGEFDLSQTSLQLTLHGIGGELAWSFEPGADSFGRISLGLTYFALAEAQITLPENAASLHPVARVAAQSIENVITENAFVPTLGLTLGWRLR